MSWRDKMSSKDIDYFKSRGLIKDIIKPHGYNLVWRFGGKDEIITLKPSPYPHCVNSRKKKEKQMQYKSGKFLILPVYE